MKKYSCIILLSKSISSINAQNNIIPNGTFENSSSAGLCIVGISNAFDGNISNWYIAQHNIDKKEGHPDWLRFNWCNYNGYCSYFSSLLVNSPSYIAIKADVHQCKEKKFGGYKIKRSHEAVGVGLLGGASFTAYSYYTIRYKIIPIKAEYLDTGGDPDHPTCQNLLTDDHLRVFLTKKGGKNWSDVSGNVKQEIINANYITSSGSTPYCNWIAVERTFVVNYSGMKNLILYAESGGFIIDDVEIFPKCDDDYLIQNKNYYFPLYAPNSQYGNHFSEQSMDYIHAGFNVGSMTTSTGNVFVGNGAAIVYTAQNKITLSPGFKAKEGSYFHALIDYCPNADRSVTDNRIDSSAMKNADDIDVLFLSDKEIQNTFELVPNPNNGTFKIYITKNEKAIGIEELKVYDIMGKVIWQTGASTNNAFDVDISNYAKGIYYVRSINANGEMETKKLVKQ